MRSGTMSRLTLMCIFALFFGEGTAFAQASRGDSVAVSAQADVGPEALSGRRGGLEWVHTQSPRSALDVGVFAISIGDTSWTYGRVGELIRQGCITASQSRKIVSKKGILLAHR